MSNLNPLFCDIEFRDDLGRWLNDHGMTGAFAEVGCAFGGYSRTVLKEWKGKTYYMIDPWTAQSADVYREKTEGINFEQYWRDVQLLAEQDSRVKLIRKLSVDGAIEIEDLSLDVVFLDGNHAGLNVLEDMDAWYPKVRPGGLFCGHDYGNDTNWPNFCEVKSAVDRWSAERCLTFTISRDSSWWIIKPFEVYKIVPGQESPTPLQDALVEAFRK